MVDGVLREEPKRTQWNTIQEDQFNVWVECGYTCKVDIISPVYTLTGTPPDGAVGPCPECPECPPIPVCPEVPDCPDCPDFPPPEPPPVDPPLPEPKMVTLEWTIPTSRVNGESLSVEELCCYDIQWRTGTSDVQTTRVDGGSTTSHVFENWPTGV